jgi:DNA polymerase I
MDFTPCDIETSGLKFYEHRILGVGFNDTYSIKNVPSGPCVAHNGKFETKFFKQNNIPFQWEFDTFLAPSVLLDRPESLKLDSVAHYYLGVESWKDETSKLMKKKNWEEIHDSSSEVQSKLAERNILDLKATKDLTPILLKKLKEEGMESFFFDRLMPSARMMAEAEFLGVRIDLPKVSKKLEETLSTIQTLEKELHAWIGATINLNSPIQLMKELKGKGYNLWYYDFKTRGMKEGTGSDVLEGLLPNPNIQKLLDYRGAVKLKGYLQGWLEEHHEGRLHCSFNLANTRTGRLSASDPNLQQIPRESDIRSLFIPSEGKKFVILDAAQVEPRFAAHFSLDKALLEGFINAEDFYGSIAVKVLGAPCKPNEVKKLYPDLRKVAKEVGLSILYGIGAGKLISIIKKKAGIVYTTQQGRKIIRDYFEAYPGLLEFREYIMAQIEGGEILRTPFGRQFRIDKDKAFSTGINTIIQSTASDYCMFSQLEVNKRLEKLGIEAPLILLVHDEAVREAKPEEAHLVGKIMEEVMTEPQFKCPLKVEWAVADNWAGKA